MTKSNGARFGALAFLGIGILVGYLAAKGGFIEAEPATAQVAAPSGDSPNASSKVKSQNASVERLAEGKKETSRQPEVGGQDDAPINKHLVDKAPKEAPAPMPHVNPNDPKSTPIKQDKSTDIWRQMREQRTDIPPGPIDIQRYTLQLETTGIKTFFNLPIARTPEDLQAGKVDVAIFGAPQGAFPHSAGSVWAPAEIRHNRDYGSYGPPSFPLGFIEYETLMAPFMTLQAVDYGDAGYNPISY